MSKSAWIITLGLVALAPFASAKPQEEPLVNLLDLAPDIVVDMRYATENNFLGKKLYDTPVCLLRKSVAQSAVKAHLDLKKQGFRLRVYDCYRPLSVQKAMWKVKPVPGLVANPKTGSNHNRGAAIDVGLSYPDGKEVKMPSDFDSFTKNAWAAYQGGPAKWIEHRTILQKAMKKQGFSTIRKEWWHFNAPRPKRFSILDISLSDAAVKSRFEGKKQP